MRRRRRAQCRQIIVILPSLSSCVAWTADNGGAALAFPRRFETTASPRRHHAVMGRGVSAAPIKRPLIRARCIRTIIYNIISCTYVRVQYIILLYTGTFVKVSRWLPDKSGEVVSGAYARTCTKQKHARLSPFAGETLAARAGRSQRDERARGK